MRRSRIWSVVALLALVSVLAACGGTTPASGGDGSLDRVKKAGHLVVAFDATYPPMEFIDADGKTVIGFDVDLAGAVAKKLGVELKVENVDWNGIIAGLTTGKRYDVIMSSMNITEERQKQVNFVEYVRMSQVFVSRKGGAVKTEQDLAGKVVAVQAETTSHEWVDQIKKDKVKDIKEIRSFPGATDTFAEVKNQRADVIIIDEPVGLYYAKLDAATFEVTGQALEPEAVGAAIRKEDAELMKAIEQAIKDLKADGTYKTISEKWFGRELGK
jgi:ABC-type amino acid transport substrate-binding protein